jgi:hypothetical protein
VILAGVGLGIYRYAKRRIGGTAERPERQLDAVAEVTDKDDVPVGWNVVMSGPIWPGPYDEDTTMVYSPLLVAHLMSYSVFRERTVDVLLMLRNRAIRWLRRCKASDHDIARVLPGSVVKAFMMQQAEYTALRSLASDRHVAGSELATRLHHQQSVMNSWATIFRTWTSGLSSWTNLITALGFRLVGNPVRVPAA